MIMEIILIMTRNTNNTNNTNNTDGNNTNNDKQETSAWRRRSGYTRCTICVLIMI